LSGTLPAGQALCYIKPLIQSLKGLVMQTETITYLKENANNLNLDEELIVTKNGKPSFVVQSYDDYQYLQQSIALLKLLALSDKSINDAAALSLEQAFSDDS
jgi:PHD/YefM family antitoxin component YafN of YafNO toxin-antitoxin module